MCFSDISLHHSAITDISCGWSPIYSKWSRFWHKYDCVGGKKPSIDGHCAPKKSLHTQMCRGYVWMETHKTPHTSSRSYRQAYRRGPLVDLLCSRLVEDADRALTATITAENRRSFPGGGVRLRRRQEEEEDEEAACRLSAAQGTPLRSSLVATGCGMRRAEKTSPAACFDSQTRAGAEERPVWKCAHGLRLSAGRKHANEDAHQRENEPGVNFRLRWPEMSVSLTGLQRNQ